ncbi:MULTISPECIES: MFS transporter [unclassified Rhizobium]|uniref:MFS transporter n=1 Tax=unclassified Rhizobium TaxID=2613769 RepID=UPI000CDF3691|nr:MULTISPECIES: MFS transporter [Rhizobium]AVA20726.1 major facilitator superfamily protein [Rhizobium sp. NXC24]MDK4738871.1 MFS transporter [Rhizobium sp. CNPSo 3464]UWU21942.1 MFS transporter [Rhizobium tropici]
MSSIQNADSSRSTSLFTLFSPEFLAPTLMLGGGVALYAVESYITATIAPSVVRDIGGLELFSWMTTLFVAAGVLGSITVATRPRGIGLRAVYVAAALIFGVGNLICAAAPAMPVVLAGRAVQGFGVGMLAALAYAFVRFVYPEPLWRKASTLYAALWGVATVLGPTLGGLFSAGSAWREAFIILVPVAGIMAFSARWLLPRVEDDRAEGKPPLIQIALLLTAVLLMSLAGTSDHGSTKILLIGLAVTFIAAMLVLERKSKTRLLPKDAVMLARPISRLYLMMFAMMMVLTSDIYIPYFLQSMHGVAPLASGYLVALVALGWTAAAFISASFSGKQAARAIIVGSVLETAATASLIAFVARDNPTGELVWLAPTVVAMFLMGFGVGLGWAHLIAGIIRLVGGAEQDKASAAISMVQSLGGAFGASLAGVIVNSAGLADPGGIAGSVSAATWLYASMALPGLVAVTVSFTLIRPASA